MIFCFMLFARVSKYELVNDGDDCVLILEREELHKLNPLDEWFLAMGFEMVREEPVYELEQIEFCQSHPVWGPEGYVMVRNHKVSQAKDCLSLVPLDTPGGFDKWRYVVGKGGLSLSSGIPVAQEFYMSMMRGGDASGSIQAQMDSGFLFLGRGMEPRYATVSARSRYSYWLAFGVNPDEQVSLEQSYRSTALHWCDPLLSEVPPPRISLSL
jgi:hypothetical protein